MNRPLERGAGIVVRDAGEDSDVMIVSPAFPYVDVADQTMALVGKDRVEGMEDPRRPILRLHCPRWRVSVMGDRVERP